MRVGRINLSHMETSLPTSKAREAYFICCVCKLLDDPECPQYGLKGVCDNFDFFTPMFNTDLMCFKCGSRNSVEKDRYTWICACRKHQDEFKEIMGRKNET